MSDNISLVETDQIEEKVQKILRQTDYTEEVAIEKLKEHGYDEIATIRAYLGITEKKAPQAKSVNQEIFRQLRHKLDSNMREYNARVERGEVKKIV
jgi:low affinity Fe/Cu permease